MKKVLMISFIVLVFVLAACTPQEPLVEETEAQAQVTEPTTINTPDPEPVSSAVPAPGIDPDEVDEMIVVEDPDVSEEVTGSVVEIEVTARQWEFDPNPIMVHQGDRVRLMVTSQDVTHGFRLPAFGISERLPPGEEVVIEFVADQVGEHPFFCSVPCGSGHSAMKGSLIVV